MAPYRIVEEGVSFGELSGEANAKKTAIAMAKELAAQKPVVKFVVEWVEKVWPKEPKVKSIQGPPFTQVYEMSFRMSL
jgi:hypothetical protein